MSLLFMGPCPISNKAKSIAALTKNTMIIISVNKIIVLTESMYLVHKMVACHLEARV